LERELESCQVDVREIGARTRRVMAATEEALTLTDPRENAFLKLHTQPKKLLKDHHTSPASTYTQTQLLLRTFDVSGKPRTSGGDPIKVEITTRRRSPPPPQPPPTSSNHEQHRRRNPSDRDQSNRCSLNQDPNHADYSNPQDRDPARVRDRTGHDRSHDQSNHQPPLSGGSIRPAQAQVPDPPDQRRSNNTSSSRRPPSDSLSNSSASTPPPPTTFTQSHLHQTITSCSTASINTNIISTTNHTDSNHDSSNHSNIGQERSRWINSATSSVSATINDNDDGTYTISFIAYEAGEYDVHVTIFGRPIKNSPYTVVVSGHHAPRWQFGSFGLGELQLKQPVKIVQDHKGFSYILDTGNNRIKMLDGNGEYLDDIHSEALKDASTVGMTILPSGDILTLNWRTKEITKCTHNGETLQVMSFSEFMEPIDITVDSRSRILIADTGCAKEKTLKLVKIFTKIPKSPTETPSITIPPLQIFVFDASFRPLFSFDVGAHCDSAPVTCVCIGLNDEILVGTCSSLLLFDPGGRSDFFSANFFQFQGSFVFALDSYGSRLRCPCGVRVGTHRWTGMCLVVDSATHSVKAYQFR
uniref:HECT domain-containing protein n=1 Tax=Anisakis simplex TaxID=6269 RepID=A0A0M3KA62_ANISI